MPKVNKVYVWKMVDGVYKEFLVRPKQKGLPYDNVYFFTDGVFTGTDAAPRTTTIKSYSNIWNAYYDRRENIFWVFTSEGLGYYDINTNEITILHDEQPRTSIGGGVYFYGDYIVFTNSDYTITVDRAAKTKIRKLTRPSGQYTGTFIRSPYNQESKYFEMGQGYAYKNVYDVATGDTIGNQGGTGYWQAIVFNDKYIRAAENVNNGIYISDITSSGVGTATTITSSSYRRAQQSATVQDSGLLDKVSPSDIEYNARYVGAARTNTGYKGINVSTKAVFYTGSGNATIDGALIKYNNDYAIAYGYGNNSSANNKIWKINRSNYTPTQLKSSLNNGADCINITSAGNISMLQNGIMDTSGNFVYQSTSFVGAFPKNVY